MVANERWLLTRGGRKGRFDCICIYISLKMSAFLPRNSEKQSMNDVRLSGVV